MPEWCMTPCYLHSAPTQLHSLFGDLWVYFLYKLFYYSGILRVHSCHIANENGNKVWLGLFCSEMLRASAAQHIVVTWEPTRRKLYKQSHKHQSRWVWGLAVIFSSFKNKPLFLLPLVLLITFYLRCFRPWKVKSGDVAQFTSYWHYVLTI